MSVFQFDYFGVQFSHALVDLRWLECFVRLSRWNCHRCERCMSVKSSQLQPSCCRCQRLQVVGYESFWGSTGECTPTFLGKWGGSPVTNCRSCFRLQQMSHAYNVSQGLKINKISHGYEWYNFEIVTNAGPKCSLQLQNASSAKRCATFHSQSATKTRLKFKFQLEIFEAQPEVYENNSLTGKELKHIQPSKGDQEHGSSSKQSMG